MSEKHERLNELRIDRADIESAGTGGGVTLAIIALVLVLAGAGGWWWWHEGSAPEVRVAVAESVRLDATAADAGETVLDASGYVTARRKATVSAKFTGKIVDVRIEEGMKVDEGQVLARLDDTLQSRSLDLAEARAAAARTALRETEVQLANAELDLRRTTELVAGNVASRARLDDARAAVGTLEARLARLHEEVEVARRTVDLRRQELDDTVIRSPFAGVIVTKNAQPGEMISPVSAGGGFTRTGIGTVVDMDSLEIEVDVNEAYIQRVEEGQPVVAVLDAYPDWQIPAHVIIAVPTADRQKATVLVRIGFDELAESGSLDRRILPDMGVKVSFLAPREDDGDDADEADAEPRRYVAVPASAVVRRPSGDAGKDVVFVVAEGAVERRAVSVARTDGGRALLDAGLREGERVVAEPSADLADGAAVEILE